MKYRHKGTFDFYSFNNIEFISHSSKLFLKMYQFNQKSDVYMIFMNTYSHFYTKNK